MEKKIYYRSGQKVRVTKPSHNASDFTRHYMPCNGVYSIEGWAKEEFTVSGEMQSRTFDEFPEIHGAYLLLHKGKEIGYVYDSALALIKPSNSVETSKYANSFKRIKARLTSERLHNKFDTMVSHYCNDMTEAERNTFADYLVKCLNGSYRVGQLEHNKESHD